MTFTDLNDPTTARVLDTGDVEATFGKGYRLQSVSLAMVPVGLWPFDLGGVLGKPVTRGIEAKIPKAILKLREQARRMQTRDVRDPYRAALGHFIRD